jgi:hypothetical protein
MKKTLLFALALVAVGCTDAGQSDLCVGPSRFGLLAFYGGPLEDVRTCAEEGIASAQFELGIGTGLVSMSRGTMRRPVTGIG